MVNVKRTGLVTNSRARSITGWFGAGLVLIKDREILIRENVCHKIKPIFGWYLCKFRGYRKVDCSFCGYSFVGYSKKINQSHKISKDEFMKINGPGPEDVKGGNIEDVR